MVYSLIFIMLAAICNAIMDKITYHWYSSVFCSNVDITWWNPEISWLNKHVNKNPNMPIKKICWGLFDVPCTDAWHTFKSSMVVLIVLAIVTFDCTIVRFWYEYIIMIIAFGLMWNLTFNLFYNKLLKSSTYDTKK